MSHNPLLPAHEDLRRAVAWLGGLDRVDLASIDEAAQRFDLSPLDEDFLLNLFRLGPSDRER
ncbi:MAG: hypothetical protein ACWGPN_02920 [Gammaproteobacteria bacterium]